MEVKIQEVKGKQIEKLKRDLPSQYGPGVLRYGTRGCVLSRSYQPHVERVRAMDVRPDDVWVITHPKCGTTWTQEMVWLIAHELDWDGAKAVPLDDRFPYIEFWSQCTPEEREIFGVNDRLEKANNSPSPRLIKSHLPRELLPDQLWTVKPKIIYVSRDAKDTANSYYHHDVLLSNYTGTQEDFFEAFLQDLLPYNSYWDHVLDFWDLRNEPYLLFNTFEEMKKDLPGVIRRTAVFLGKSLNDEEITSLAEHLDIKSMRKNPTVNLQDELKLMREAGRAPEKGEFIRQGKVGEGRKAMSPDMAARFDAKTKEKFGPVGHLETQC